MDDGVDGGGLSRAGTSREDHDAVPHAFQHRPKLQRLQLDSEPPRQLFNIMKDLFFFRRKEASLRSQAHIQIRQHSGAGKLRIIEDGSVYEGLLLHLFDHQLALHRQIRDLNAHIFHGKPQKLRRLLLQLRLWQTGISVRRRELQGIKDAASDPEIGIRMNADPGRQLIRPPESDAVDILRKAVGIFLQNMIDLFLISLINLHRQRIGNPVFLQVDHRLAHFLFFFHLCADLHGPAFADPLDLRKALRLLFHDPEGISPEFLHNPRGKRGTDSPDGPGAQIPLDALFVLQNRLHETFHLKLDAVYRMFHIAARKLQPLPLVDGLKAPDAGDLLPVGNQFKNGIAILRIPVYDMIHIAGYLFRGCFIHSDSPDALRKRYLRPAVFPPIGRPVPQAIRISNKGCSKGAAPIPVFSSVPVRPRPCIRPGIPHIFLFRSPQPSSDPQPSWY